MGGSSKRAQALREMGRQLVISLMSMLALTITFSESATGQSYISLINRNSRLFDQDAIDESLMYFKFSAEGKLIDGPRRDAGEEIDISSIVSHDEVTRVFTQSIFDCIEGVRYCDRNKIKLPIDPISFRITNIDGQEFPEYSKKLSERILLAANFLGLDVQSEGQDGSEIEFIVVDPSSAIEAAKRTEDPYAVAYFEWEKQKADEGKGPKVALGLCYTSTKDRAIGKIFILLTPSGVDDCSMRSFLIALGLNETGGYFPSATGVDGSYKFPTLVDRAFVSILYSSDFPVDQGVDVVESYARKYLYDNPSLLKEND